jgi:hypothetical protein
MKVFSNKELDMTVVGAVWFKTIPSRNITVGVSNEIARTAMTLGSVDPPAAAKEFDAQLGFVDVDQYKIVLLDNNPLDTRTFGLFLAKNESFKIVQGAAVFITDESDFFETGQVAICEVGTIIELNCSQEVPEEPTVFWRLDAVLGWVTEHVWDVPSVVINLV